LTVLGVLLIATLTIQTATAAARNARKSVRAAVPVTQQPREGLSAPLFIAEAVIDFGATRTGHLFLRRANDLLVSYGLRQAETDRFERGRKSLKSPSRSSRAAQHERLVRNPTRAHRPFLRQERISQTRRGLKAAEQRA
jgi:hypothetical protein